MNITLSIANKISGTIEVPADKSISHRALIIGALAKGSTEVKNLLKAADVLYTKKCLQDLGVNITDDDNKILVKGVEKTGFKEPASTLNVGNSGTTIRIMAGILAAQRFTSTITGDPSIRKRPMNRIIGPLIKMGANISAEPGGFAPLKIIGRKLNSINYKLEVASAQVKTCLLLSGILADGKTSITEKYKSRDHTERMLKYLGADLIVNDNSYTISSKTELKAKPIVIPGDLSSAAFFIVAAAIVPGSELLVKGVGVNPSRAGIIKVMQRSGINLKIENPREKNNEPLADLKVSYTPEIKSFEITETEIPVLIDELPILAVLATQAHGQSVIRGARELKIKETDRITSMAQGLQRMGADIKATDDGFVINGSVRLKGSILQSYDDHRTAMSLAIAALIAQGQTTIIGADCIETSFPKFEQMLKSVVK